MTRTLGVTVMPEFIQNEGVEPLLDNLQRRAGVTALATSPYVMAPAPEGQGGREPPLDADAGKVRLLDRPLWGRRELFVTTAPSFKADASLYAGLRYQPPPADELTAREGDRVAAFVGAARARGLKVYLQVQAAIPPGYRVQFGGPQADDEPRLPDGRPVPNRVDRNASLASPHVRHYGCALLRDLCRAYPEIDGVRIDWPEYPPYAFDALFLDFSDHAVQAGERLGYDMERLRRDAAAVYRALCGGLDGAWLDYPGQHLGRLLARHPGALDLLRLKSDLVDGLLAAYRAALPADKALLPQAFPPPWSLLSGFDFGRAAAHATAIGVKLYTMHWPMMLRFYADALAAANPGLDGGRLTGVLWRLLDTGGPEPAAVADLRYPETDEPHPVGAEAQARKVRAAQAEAGACPTFAIAHGYGSVDDFAARAATAWAASGGRMWVNRYGYLSDAKLDALGALARE